MKMKAAQRKQISKAVYELLKPCYFDEIPLGKLQERLKEFGVVILQEDNTEWSGFLCGNNNNCVFTLGSLDSKQSCFYEEYNNVRLFLGWYKDSKRNTRNYEIIGYIS